MGYDRIMNQKDADEFSEICKEYGKKVTKSKRAAQKELQEFGSHDKDGNLTEHYRQPEHV